MRSVDSTGLAQCVYAKRSFGRVGGWRLVGTTLQHNNRGEVPWVLWACLLCFYVMRLQQLAKQLVQRMLLILPYCNHEQPGKTILFDLFGNGLLLNFGAVWILVSAVQFETFKSVLCHFQVFLS